MPISVICVGGADPRISKELVQDIGMHGLYVGITFIFEALALFWD
jgi:hypothetical protein